MRTLRRWMGAGGEPAPGALASELESIRLGHSLDPLSSTEAQVTVYTFYMCNADGSSNTLEAFALTSDEEAGERAARMIAQHLNCAYVTAFDDERPVLVRHRAGLSAGGGPGGPAEAHAQADPR